MLRVGGVPEHFNLPWRVAADSAFWPALGLDVDWREQPGGTGEMLGRLKDGSLDLAVLLTEGVVRSIAQGLRAKIVAQYISSPLLWGIHVGGGSRFRSEASLIRNARFAISRRGSGSHLMGYVLAQRLGFKLTDDRLVVVGTLDGARDAISRGEADVLLWDRFMLSPLVEAGELRRVGVQPTPWPSFVVAARTSVLAKKRENVASCCRGIAELAQTLRLDSRTPALAVDLYGLREEETADWLKTTQWDASPLATSQLQDVQRQLREVGILKSQSPAGTFLA